jgi:Ca-activated chloride channel family protein
MEPTFKPLTVFLLIVLGIFAIVGIAFFMLPPQVPSPASTPAAEPQKTLVSAGNRPLEPVSISIITSDTKAEWLEEATERFNSAGIQVKQGSRVEVDILREGSPLGIQESILNGTVQPTIWSPGEISWVDSANEINKNHGKPPLVSQPCPTIVYSATGFAMWRPMAEALGWPDQPIGWDEIVELSANPEGWAAYGHPEWGSFKFGHAHPEQSTTGFTMMATLAYNALDITSGLTPQMVKSEPVREAFRVVEEHTYHYGLSTRGLLTLMAQRGPAYLHAVTSSETSMLKSNEVQKDTLPFPFVFIFPAEGTFWMDNPFCILDTAWVSSEQREAAGLYRDFLLSPEQQDLAVTIGLRPADAKTPLHDPISLAYGTDPRVSPHTVPPLAAVDGETGETIVDLFKQTKKKATVIIAVDVSQSMQGEKIKNALRGTMNFINRLGRDDQVYVTIFNDTPLELEPGGQVGTVAEALDQKLEGLFVSGNTALYDAVCQSVKRSQELEQADRANGENRLYGIVVLSDGDDTNSQITENDMFQCLPSGEDVKEVKIFTISYGEDANGDLLLMIANRTNGKTYAGNPKSIEDIYLAISAEQ